MMMSFVLVLIVAEIIWNKAI